VTGRLYKVSAYLNAEELREFNRSVIARGAGQSAYVREMLGFEVRPRGAPKGPRKKKPPEAGPTKKRAAKTKAAVKKKAERKRPGTPREQLSFLD
jgi:hypothetical protein